MFLPVTLPRSEPLCWHRRFSVSYYRDSPGTFCQWPYPEVSRCVDIEGFLYHIIGAVQELFASDLTQKWAVVLTSKVFCIILSGQELFAGDLTQKWAVVLTSKVFCIILSGQSRNFLPVTLPRSEPLCWHRRFSVSYYWGSPGTFCQWPYPEVSRCVDIEGFLYHIIGADQELFAGDLTQKWAVVLTSKGFLYHVIGAVQELFAGDLTQKWAVVLISKVFCIILSGQTRNFLPVTLPRSEPLCWHRRFSVSYYRGSPGTFCQWPYPEVSRCIDIEGFLYHIIRTVVSSYPEVSRCVDIEGFLYHITGAVQELFASDLTQKWAVVLTSKVFCIILLGQSRNFLPVTLPRSEPLCWHRRFSVSYNRDRPGTFCQWPYPEVSSCVDIEGFLYHIIGTV